MGLIRELFVTQALFIMLRVAPNQNNKGEFL